MQVRLQQQKVRRVEFSNIRTGMLFIAMDVAYIKTLQDGLNNKYAGVNLFTGIATIFDPRALVIPARQVEDLIVEEELAP